MLDKLKFIIRLLAQLCCICLAMNLHAQWDEYIFQKFTRNHGLPDNNVICMDMDQSGFLWIGTDNGLSRFDGKNFINFKSNPLDSNSLSGNVIRHVYCDKNNDIWVSAHRNGLSKYNQKLGKFRRYHFNINQSINHTSLIETSFIIEDSKQNLWIGVFGGGIIKLDPKSGDFDQFVFDERKALYNFNECQKAAIDKDGMLWITTRVGLIKFNPQNGAHEKLIYPGTDPLNGLNLITNISITDDNKIILSTWERGINILDPENNQWNNYLIDDSSIDLANIVHSAIPWADRQILFSSNLQGFGLLGLKSGKASFVDKSNPAIQTFLFDVKTGHSVKRFRDQIFIATNKGLLQLSKRPEIVHRYEDRTYPVAKLKGIGLASSFLDIPHTPYIFISSFYRNGIFAFSRNQNRVEKNLFLDRPENLNNVLDMKGNVHDSSMAFVASRSGLLYFNPNQPEKLKQYLFKNDSINNLLKGKPVFKLNYAPDGKLWMFFKDHLIEWDQKNEVITDWMPLLKQKSQLSDYIFYNAAFDNHGNLFLNNNKEELLHFVKPESDVALFNPSETFKNINPKQINDVVFTKSKKLVLLINYSGLLTYDFTSGDIDYLGEAAGLKGSVYKSITEDANGNIWALSENTISMVDIQKRMILNFGEEMGFNLFQAETIGCTNDNRIYACATHIVYVFDPSELVKLKQASFSIYIDQIRLFDKELGLSEAPDQVEKITLKHYENFLSLEFSIPDLSRRHDFYYYYRFEGKDDDWIYLGQENRLILNNLKSGGYKLNIRAKNGLGEWCTPDKMINIMIIPPFWERWWFYLLIMVLGVLVIISYIKIRISNVKRKATEKQKMQQQLNELENQALRSQMNPHFIFNSLNSINSYIIKNKPDEASEYVGKFARLIRLILDNSKESAVTLHNEIAALKLYVEIENKRFSNKFEWNIHVDSEVNIHNTLVPPMIFQPFVENAIWHGLLHKSSQGNLSIHISQTAAALRCEITDDGIGRAAAKDLKSKTSLQNKSHGMTLTMKRIENFNKNANVKDAIQIIDLYDENEQAIGTKVILNLTSKIKQENE